MSDSAVSEVVKSGMKSTHWADITADKILRERGEKDRYVCASGITPSGTVHIGNFREIISVELVVRALREKLAEAGVSPGEADRRVRFIYSWDEFDVFRKVPANMPDRERLEGYLRQSITRVPDVKGSEESYARANEKELEELLPQVGVEPEYIYQAAEYGRAAYAEGMKRALDSRETLRRLLDAHRSEPLPEDWYPASVFCGACHRDTTRVTGWDGEWTLSYTCGSCGNTAEVDLRQPQAELEAPSADGAGLPEGSPVPEGKKGDVKLPWRIDWPMRWKHEGVDFEPAGKDHHSEGGSFDTAEEIVREVYGAEPPVTFQYDFIRIKGRGGKISSSGGEVVGLAEVLEVYQPEVVRFLFAGTRPNSEFAISFDLDVLKIYEDYDKCERTYFQKPENPKKLKKWAKQARIYELCQTGAVPSAMPYQIPIRHLCNLLQIHGGDAARVIDSLGDVEPGQRQRLEQRARCAWNWVKDFAPEDFRFSLRRPEELVGGAPSGGGLAEELGLSGAETAAVRQLGQAAEDFMDREDEKTFSNRVYDAARDNGLESQDFFPAVYRVLIGKEKGPRLVSFLYAIGRERVAALLKAV